MSFSVRRHLTRSVQTVGNLVLWFDADAEDTITGGSAVSDWVNRALPASTYDLIQGTAGNKPSSGTRTVNSRNCIDFAATAIDDTNGDWMYVDATPITTQTFTAFCVFVDDGTAWQGVVWDFVDRAGNGDLHFVGQWMNNGGTDDEAIMATREEASNIIQATSNTTTSGTQSLYWVDDRRADSDYDIWLDGTKTERIGNTLTLTGIDRFCIGARGGPTHYNLFDGAICEIIVYDTSERYMTDNDKEWVEAYLKNKWNTG